MKKEIRIVGGTAEFEELLINVISDDNILVRFDSSKDAVNTQDLECTAYFILPNYEKGDINVPEMDFETIEKFAKLQLKGQKLFIENYMAGDYLHSGVFGHQVDGKERHFFNEYLVADDKLKEELKNGYVLQARNSYYYPGRAMGYHTALKHNVLLTATDCIGTHNVYKEGSFSFPVLGRVNNFFYSAMNMTQFDRLTMLPVFRWSEIYAFLLNELLGIEKVKVKTAFKKLFKPISFCKDDNTLENSVKKSVQWHFDAGLLLEEDGSKGMFEMIRSNDLKVRGNIRTDSDLMTGFLLCLYGKRENNQKLVQTGKNLIDFLLNNGIQKEDGITKGLFKWFHNLGIGPHEIYSTDTSRDGLMMLNMYKLFKSEEYLERGRRLGDALIRWLGPEGLLCGSFNAKAGYSDRQTIEHITDNPVYYGEMTSFLLQLYKFTNDEKYKNAVLKYAGKIMDKFPNTKPFGYSDNFTYSRYLLMLLSIQEILGIDLSEKINKCLCFFKNLEHPSGGICEAPIRLAKHPEAGVGIGDGSDNIADTMYSNNFVLCALSIAHDMKNPYSVDLDLTSTIYKNLIAFILRIQINDEDKRLNGGWMRAFDMDNDEYYGLNKDKDWGAYCIMAGWQTGYIPMVFLNELGEQSIFTN